MDEKTLNRKRLKQENPIFWGSFIWLDGFNVQKSSKLSLTIHEHSLKDTYLSQK